MEYTLARAAPPCAGHPGQRTSARVRARSFLARKVCDAASLGGARLNFLEGRSNAIYRGGCEFAPVIDAHRTMSKLVYIELLPLGKVLEVEREAEPPASRHPAVA